MIVMQIVVYHIDTKLWYRAVQRVPQLERCCHCAVKFGESILVLGGYKEVIPATESSDSFNNDTSMNSSKLERTSLKAKKVYYKLDEIITIEIGHHVVCLHVRVLVRCGNWKTRDRKAWTRQINIIQKVISSIKDYIFQWNVTMFPSDQISSQLEVSMPASKILASSLLMQTSQAQTSEIKENEESPFADFNEEEEQENHERILLVIILSVCGIFHLQQPFFASYSILSHTLLIMQFSLPSISIKFLFLSFSDSGMRMTRLLYMYCIS